MKLRAGNQNDHYLACRKVLGADSSTPGMVAPDSDASAQEMEADGPDTWAFLATE